MTPGSTAARHPVVPQNTGFFRSEFVTRFLRDLGRKRPKNTKSKGQMMKLGYGNAKEGRSTSLAIDLWIKTCQNAQDSQIDPKANWGYFWWKFSNFSKSKKNLGDLWGKQSQIRGNLCSDTIWWSYDLMGCPIFTDWRRMWTNTRKNTKNTRTQRGIHGGSGDN